MKHIIFDYGVQMRPAQFKSNVSEIVLSLGELLKYGGPEVKEAIRSGMLPMLTKPTKPELQTINNAKQTEVDILKETETYKVEFPQYLKDKRQWTTNNKQIYMRYKQHTSPAMETKLKSMPDYEGIVSSQDGLRLIKLHKLSTSNKTGLSNGWLRSLMLTSN